MVDFRVSVCAFLVFMLLCADGGIVAGILKVAVIAAVFAVIAVIGRLRRLYHS